MARSGERCRDGLMTDSKRYKIRYKRRRRIEAEASIELEPHRRAWCFHGPAESCMTVDYEFG
jgi:hypothetical protein